jgi:hypothetical protein
MYAEQLSRWYRYFPKQNIYVMTLESFIKNPSNELKKLIHWMGLNYLNKEIKKKKKMKSDSSLSGYTSQQMVNEMLCNHHTVHKNSIPLLALQKKNKVTDGRIQSIQPSDKAIVLYTLNSNCSFNSTSSPVSNCELSSLPHYLKLKAFYNKSNKKLEQLLGRKLEW